MFPYGIGIVLVRTLVSDAQFIQDDQSNHLVSRSTRSEFIADHVVDDGNPLFGQVAGSRKPQDVVSWKHSCEFEPSLGINDEPDGGTGFVNQLDMLAQQWPACGSIQHASSNSETRACIRSQHNHNLRHTGVDVY
jgi:hypothetical protein